MTYAYVGNTVDDAELSGVSCFSVDDDTGQLSFRQIALQARPSYLAAVPSRRRVYAASHSSSIDGQPGAAIYGYSSDSSTGGLREINHRFIPLTFAAMIRTDPTERFLLVACTRGGGVAVLPIDETGALGEPTSVQMHPGTALVPFGSDTVPEVRPPDQAMPHSIGVDPSDRLVVVPDLTLNALFLYHFDSENGTLDPCGSVPFPPKSGPRHFMFAPKSNYLYVLSELASTVTVASYDPVAGTVELVDSLSTIDSSDTRANKTAEIVSSSDGRFIYCSNRGHDSVAVFTVSTSSPFLELVDLVPADGRDPRHLAITPDGRFMFVANESSNAVNSFAINSDTGQLVPTGFSTEVAVPTCVVFI